MEQYSIKTSNCLKVLVKKIHCPRCNLRQKNHFCLCIDKLQSSKCLTKRLLEPRLDLSGTPGLRPIGLSPGSWQTSLGLGSMSRYSAQILICISSNISRVCFTVISHTPVRSGFYHIHIVDRRNCYGSCLLNLTQQSCIFFKFAICSIALLNLGETCHLRDAAWWRCGTRCCCYAATIVKARSNIMTSRCLNTYCDVTQCMNGLWIFITKTWIAQGRFINIIRTPSKQWGMCDNSEDSLCANLRVQEQSTNMTSQ